MLYRIVTARRCRAWVWACIGWICSSLTLAAQLPVELTQRIDQLLDAETDRLVELFKDIHRNPELGFMETRTAGIVAAELRALGFEVKTGIGGTGVVGILTNGDGPVVMYRADMDANAVEEATGLPYASTVRVKRDDGLEVPVAHMCGHDAHVTWMLGMARILAEMKDAWRGTLVLVGQPAEELIEGAQAMVDAGLYERHGVPRPDFLIGMHTAPIPVGVAASSGGPKMAGTDQLDILFRGVGGHGSMPHMARDPVLMAAMAVVQFQAIVSRIVDPQQTAVLSVGSIQAGADNNIIPDTATVRANLRWYSPQVREQMLQGIRTISENIARSFGMPEDQLPEITLKGSSTPLVNDTALAERLAGTLRQVLGERSVITDIPPATGSEDAHLLKGPYDDVPFNYLLVGVADPGVFAQALAKGREIPYSAHSPNYIVDLKAIPVGSRVATHVMLELLGRPR